MTASARTKAAKRRNRRARNNALRCADLKLRIPPNMGLVAAAELAVEEEAAERERREAKANQAKREKARQTPMQRYLARGEVTQQQFLDAERLWQDFMQSGLTATVTGSYGAAVPGSGQPTPGCGPRYMQYRDAMRAVGIILSPVLAWVVISGRSAGSWADRFGCDPRDGMATLQNALDALGAHYRRRTSCE